MIDDVHRSILLDPEFTDDDVMNTAVYVRPCVNLIPPKTTEAVKEQSQGGRYTLDETTNFKQVATHMNYTCTQLL